MDLQTLFKSLLLNQSTPASQSTVKNYVSDIRYFSNWFSRNYKKPFVFTEFTAELIQHFSQDTAVSPRTKTRQLASLKKFTTLLESSGESIENPFQNSNTVTPQDAWDLRLFKHSLYKQKASPLTVKNYMSDINHFTKWLDAHNITLDDIKTSKDIINSYGNSLIHVLNLSPKSVNRKLSSIRKYLTFCGEKNPGLSLNNLPSSLSISVSNAVNSSSIHSQQGKEITALEAFRIQEPTYSPITPVRLAQQVGTMYGKFEEKAAYHISRLVPKRYSLSIPSGYSLFHGLKNHRPNWYKAYHTYSVTKYIHIAVLTLFSSGLLLFGYDKYIYLDPTGDVLGTSLQNRRVLMYSGKLSSSDNTPITKSSRLTFSIYPDHTAKDTVLWKETHEINPNQNGSFTVELGRKEILSDRFFTDNQNLYLGMQIGTDAELLPRQRLANVGYAQDTGLLQGMAPITENPNNAANSILALDSTGNLVIGGTANPVFQATGGEFTVSGTTTIVSTVTGSNGDIVLDPDGSGVIDVRRPFVNNYQDASGSGAVDFADEVVIASDSANSLLTVNNTGNFGDIMTLMSQNISRMVVDNSGNVGIGTATPSQLVHIADENIATIRVEHLLSQTKLDISSLNNMAILGTQSNSLLGFKTNDLIRMTIAPDGNVGIGTSNPTAKLDVSGSASIAGTLTLTGGTRSIQTANNNNLIVGGNTTGNIILQPLSGKGFVGISTNNPLYKLDVRDSQASGSATQIFNTSTSADADGLNIRLGNNQKSVAATNNFITFQTEGMGTVASISGSLDGTGVAYNTHNADFAEYFKKDENENIPYGAITCLTSSGSVSTCSSQNTQIIGVTSNNPGFLGGKNLGSRSIIVGLVGQIETYVSTENGSISAGDPITLSSKPGIGIKATSGGMIVGRALQSYTAEQTGKILVLVQPSWHEPKATLTAQGELVTTELPTVHLATESYDLVANALLRTTSHVRRKNTSVLEVVSFASATIGSIKTGLLEVQHVVVSGTLAARHVVVEQLDITTDNVRVNGLTLSEYIASILPNDDFTPEVATANQVSTNFISPLAQDSEIAVNLENSKFEILDSSDASGSAVATIDNTGNATFSGSLTAQSGEFGTLTGSGDASIAGTLSADTIRANTIEGLDEKVASLLQADRDEAESQSNELETINHDLDGITPSFNTGNWQVEPGNFIDVGTMSAQFAMFHENLLSLGTTTLREATVMDSFSIGTNFIFGAESLDVLGADLQIQPLRQGGVSFLAGLVAIDQDGNLTVGGDATFAQNITVKGGLFANIISPLAEHDLDIFLPQKNGTQSAQFRVINDAKMPILTVDGTGDVYSSGSANFVGNLVASGSAFLSQLNIFSQEAQAVSDSELIASSSAGTAVLKSYKREVTIRSPYVSGDSLIYITPSTNTGNQVLYLLRQSEDGSFTVGVNQATARDIHFNWFVVN